MNTAAQHPWQLTVGDPSLLGWLTFTAYALAALLCWRAQRAGARGAGLAGAAAGDEAARSRLLGRWWLGLAALMLLLGLNKQADLQTLLTEFGKEVAQAQGWYASRARVQAAFVALLALALAGIGLALVLALRSVLARIVPALLGVASIFAFVALRALALHGLRQGPAAELLHGVWLLELAGIGLVAGNAWQATRALGRQRR